MKRTSPAPTGGPSDYDLTGLNITSTWIDYHNITGSDQNPKAFGGGGKSTQTVGGPYGTASAVVDISGTSTWKWLWTPPTVNGTQATLTQAPAQPLWILAKTYGEVLASGASGNPGVGLDGDGDFYDGFGGHDWFNFPGQAPSDMSTIPRRNLIETSLGADQKTATLLTSPSAHVELLGGQQYATGYPPMGGGSAGGEAGLSEAVCPVLLSSPNPLGHPELGDGTNQYVYDFNPVSGLTIDGWVNVLSATQDDTSWASPQIQLDTDISGEQPWNWQATIGELQPDVVNPNPNGVSYSRNKLLFLGLPNNNSDLGNHTVTLTVNDSDARKANIQTFFQFYV